MLARRGLFGVMTGLLVVPVVATGTSLPAKAPLSYASQELPTMWRNYEKEAASIIANTSGKIFMRSENANRTGAPLHSFR